MHPNVLPDEELEGLAIAAISGAPTTERQIVKLLHWAETTLLHAALVKLAISGELKVDVRKPNPDEWLWSNRE